MTSLLGYFIVCSNLSFLRLFCNRLILQDTAKFLSLSLKWPCVDRLALESKNNIASSFTAFLTFVWKLSLTMNVATIRPGQLSAANASPNTKLKFNVKTKQ